jgi:hypothetical protein
MIRTGAFVNDTSLSSVTINNSPFVITVEADAFPPSVPVNYTEGGPSTPTIFIRPKPFPTSIVYTVNPDVYTSSVYLNVVGAGGGEYSFAPTGNWYQYTVTGLTTSTEYSASIYQYNSFNQSSLTTQYRTVMTGNKPDPVQDISGVYDVTGNVAVLTWNPPVSDGGATVYWNVIRDLTNDVKYNVPGYIYSYSTPVLLAPGSNLYSVEAVNDPGYSPRSYWSTIV